MYWLIILIGMLLIISILWLIVEHKRVSRHDKKIFDEYLEKQRRVKFNGNEQVESVGGKDGEN